MEFRYETMGANTYLVYDLKYTDRVDSPVLGALVNNQTKGMLKPTFLQTQYNYVIKYDTTSRIPATSVFSGTVDKKHFIGILRGIVDAYNTATLYNIPLSTIKFDWNYIYTHVSTGETCLICVPIYGAMSIYPDFRSEIKSLINRLQFEQNEDCSYVAVILNYLNSVEQFDMSKFGKVLQMAEGKKRFRWFKGRKDRNNNSSQKNEQVVRVPGAPVISKAPQYEYGETMLLDDMMGAGETTLLEGNSTTPLQRNAYLQRQKSGERIPLGKPVYNIGTDRMSADYYVDGNTAVSRRHATIIYKNEDYYIIDNDSTNHTYVNEAKIQSKIEVKLENGASIRLGNEYFEFMISD